MVPVISVRAPVIAHDQAVWLELVVEQRELVPRSAIAVGRVDVGEIERLIRLPLKPIIGEGHLDAPAGQTALAYAPGRQGVSCSGREASEVRVWPPVPIIVAMCRPPWINKRDLRDLAFAGQQARKKAGEHHQIRPRRKHHQIRTWQRYISRGRCCSL